VHEFEVPRHPEAEQRIVEATLAWWAQYDAGLVAPPQSADELEAMLDDGSYRDLSGRDDIREMLEERRDIKSRMSAEATRLGEIEYTLKNTLGPASSAWLPGWQIEFRRRHRKAYTVAEAEIRTLRIKETSLE